MSSNQLYECRLPKEIRKACSILKEIQVEKKSLNNALYQFPPKGRLNIPRIRDLLIKALRHKDELNAICSFLRNKYKESKHLDDIKVSILATELFWGRGHLPTSDNNTIKMLLDHQEELSKLISSSSGSSGRIRGKGGLPRYARINLLRTTVEKVLGELKAEGWVQISCGTSYQAHLELLSTLQDSNFMQDFHIPELLVFPPNTNLHKHPLVTSSCLILQAKSSCLPVRLLNPQQGSVVLDMCAAPGMKTSHLAAHMNDIGKIHAMELDKQRFDTMNTILQQANVTCVKTYNEDVLKLQQETIPGITHVLVDPSCSGSGMMRPEMEPKSEERIRKLAAFQFRVLCKAMWLPKVRRVVYSTCSVLPVENEQVVAAALDFMGHTFKVVDPWPEAVRGDFTRGSSDYPGGELCTYLLPERDYTTGFFVAVLERNSRKKKSRKDEAAEESAKETLPSQSEGDGETQPKRKRKQKKEHLAGGSEDDCVNTTKGDGETQPKKKKKQKKENLAGGSEDDCVNTTTGDGETQPKKKKKPKKEHLAGGSEDNCVNTTKGDGETQPKKKKKKKKESLAGGSEDDCVNTTKCKDKKKKSKK